MALTDEDLAAIGKLMDTRLAEQDRRGRRRRRFWFWFWMVVLFGSTLAGAWWTRKLIAEVRAIEDTVARAEEETREAVAAYQKRLAEDRAMQRERAEAEKHAGYRPTPSTAEFDADLLRSVVKLYAQAKQQQQAVATADESDEEALLKQLEDSPKILGGATDTLMRLLLRESDPRAAPAREAALQADAPREPAGDERLRELERERLNQAPVSGTQP